MLCAINFTRRLRRFLVIFFSSVFLSLLFIFARKIVLSHAQLFYAYVCCGIILQLKRYNEQM
ncbi:hypothetical protein PUN28_000417 [Cardiocondyla obscurior]|uniref:Uncharacterized protein n=1 Tax=Cardiocondyla obscurior TaxID=286306 RepID=A0AAW2GZM9_9HYME